MIAPCISLSQRPDTNRSLKPVNMQIKGNNTYFTFNRSQTKELFLNFELNKSYTKKLTLKDSIINIQDKIIKNDSLIHKGNMNALDTCFKINKIYKDNEIILNKELIKTNKKNQINSKLNLVFGTALVVTLLFLIL